jgi:hypothetical protein
MAGNGTEELDKASYEWIDHLEQRLENSPGEFAESDPLRVPRIIRIIWRLRPEVQARANAEGWSARDLCAHHEALYRHLRDLDWIIRPGYGSSILRENDNSLWQHLNIAELYQNTSQEQRNSFGALLLAVDAERDGRTRQRGGSEVGQTLRSSIKVCPVRSKVLLDRWER